MWAKILLSEKVLPHIGGEDTNNKAKAHFLGNMARQLIIHHLKDLKEEDRDHYGKKRIDTTGDLMLSLFKTSLKSQFIEHAVSLLQNQKNVYLQEKMIANKTALMFDRRIITNRVRSALTTGKWGNSIMGESVRFGVAQTLKRDTSYFATLSNLRRVVAPLVSSSKDTKPRLLHNTHFGIICPSETPEG